MGGLNTVETDRQAQAAAQNQPEICLPDGGASPGAAFLPLSGIAKSVLAIGYVITLQMLPQTHPQGRRLARYAPRPSPQMSACP